MIDLKAKLVTLAGLPWLAVMGGYSAAAQEVLVAPDAQSSATKLEEIIVTAQRRGQSAQAVPIAVTTFTAAKLDSIGVITTDQLLAVTPGLSMTRQNTGLTPYIRGVGAQSVAAGNEAAVAMYVDGVYYQSPYANIFSFKNVEQIEVLKGPQGTLFGRNATGGLIQITTRDPQSEPIALGGISYGNYGTVEASAYASAGSDKIAFDIAGSYIHQEHGFGHNLFNGQDVGYRREKGVRSKIRWTPTDDLTVTLAGDYSRLNSDVGLIIQPAAGTLTVLGTPSLPNRFDTNLNTQTFSHTKSRGASAKIEYKLGELTLSSLTAYRKANTLIAFDQDLTPVPLVNIVALTQSDHSFQQEFLVQGKSGNINYTGGLFYFDAGAAYDPLTVTSAFVPTVNFDSYAKLKTKSYAVFGQIDAQFGQTTVTAGVRYTLDKRSFDGKQVAVGSDPNNPANILIGPDGHPISAVGAKKFPKVTWRLAVNQELNSDMHLYGSYTRGFKSGVFATGAISDTPIKPEVLDAFEAGLKSDFFDRKLRLNLSGFYYLYKDIQLNRIENGAGVLLNAAEGRTYGAEAEGAYATDFAGGQLTLSFSATYLHARYKSFPNGPVTIPQAGGGNLQTMGDLSGNTMVRSPDWTASLGADYKVAVSSSADLLFSANYFHSDSYYWEPENRQEQKAYDLLNAQVALSFDDDRFRIRVFGRNLTNQFYYAHLVSSALGDQVSPADPRTYGIGVDFRF